jgi:CRP/FNR family transcriptional regulator, nitrogen fixation regulation protein
MTMPAQVLATRSEVFRRPIQIRTVDDAPESGLPAAFAMMGAPLGFGRNEEVFGEGESAEYLYRVNTGCIRTYKVLSDGRRQVGAFYLPGDVFGIEAGDEHLFSAEAIVPSTVTVLKRSIVFSRAAGDLTLARQLLELAGSELHRAQSHVLLLIKTAQERVVGFLLEMAARARSRTEIELPMSRQDIADYLGLTIETVSRTLTHLESSAAIALPSARRVVVRNHSALSRFNA